MAARCFFPRQQPERAVEALEKLHHGGRVVSREEVGGAVRVKIVVSKRELKQMVAALGGAADATERHVHPGQRAAGAEQRLHALRRRSMRRAEAERRASQGGGEWAPGLQSIPEEVYSLGGGIYYD